MVHARLDSLSASRSTSLGYSEVSMRWSLAKRVRGTCLGIIGWLLFATPVAAVPDVTLWVVQPPGQLVAFDLSDLARIGGVRIPAVAFSDPSRLAINGHGQFLVQLDDRHLWLWDGTKASTLPIAPKLGGDATAFSAPARTPARQWLLGDDGNSLLVVESVARETDETGADTLETPLRMLETDLAQRLRAEVFRMTVKPCRRPMLLVAETEPCPDPSVWAPAGVARGCTVLTRWQQVGDVPKGDLPEASCLLTRYLRTPSGWKASEFSSAWGDEPLLDMSSDGAAWAQAVSDNGCCGWSNGSSDQTFFGHADSTEVVFDEWPQFGNKDYDVSFFTAGARIAPDLRHVALSVHATEGPAADIRVSAEGHADSLELKSVRAALAELPMVEIVTTGPRPAEILRLPHAELVGWASDSAVVVVEGGQVAVVDVPTGRRHRLDVSVRTAADVLVVWR